MSQAERDDLRARRIAAARRLLANNPSASLREIARDVAIATKRRRSTDRAREIRQYMRSHPEPLAAAHSGVVALRTRQ
jgi:hypothetical protein